MIKNGGFEECKATMRQKMAYVKYMNGEKNHWKEEEQTQVGSGPSDKKTN